MAKGNDVPDWMAEEQQRAESQAATGQVVNPEAKGAPKTKVTRRNKAFQVEAGREAKWHMLVAQQKAAGRGGNAGPELIDEALDLLFAKYEEKT